MIKNRVLYRLFPNRRSGLVQDLCVRPLPLDAALVVDGDAVRLPSKLVGLSYF